MAAYAYHLEPDDNGTFLITAPALPEVTSFSETADEAPAHARDAIEEAIAARISSGAPVPTERPAAGDRVVALPILSGLKVDLYAALKASGLTRAELGRRLGWKNRTSVDRLFDLSHQSRTDQIEAALLVLGRRIDVSVEPIGESRSFAQLPAEETQEPPPSARATAPADRTETPVQPEISGPGATVPYVEDVVRKPYQKTGKRK